jgi:hypothetical protein
VGFHAVLGAKEWTQGADVQVSGTALKMPMGLLVEEFNTNRKLRDRLLKFVRYLHSFDGNTSSVRLTASLGSVTPR